MRVEWIWELLREPCKHIGDIFIIVSPDEVVIWVADPEAVYQITNRRDDFPKSLRFYQMLNIYGRNLISTEGDEWKQHRKITSPSFNEKNSALAFGEACNQAQAVLRKWSCTDLEGSATIKCVPEDAQRLMLHIISNVGFGTRLLWPGESPPEGEEVSDEQYATYEAPKGHSMSFGDSMSTLLEQVYLVLLTPTWLMKLLPIQAAREGYKSYINWGQYMNEMLAHKVKQIQTGEQHDSENMDLMGTLAKTSYGKSKSKNTAQLSDSDILGNSFAFLLAGHETTATSIHICLMELAINSVYQRKVQDEVQAIFGDMPPETWDYSANISALLSGILGSTLNEQLRLMPPVTNIPKQVSMIKDQALILDGREVTLPAGALIEFNLIGLHRDPKYWPTQPSKLTNALDDLNDFRPDRWFVHNAADTNAIAPPTDDLDFNSTLFRPLRGSYAPFSLGARSCLGRRLAQVEVMGVLAVIFQTHSVELAVDEWASDEQVVAMTTEQKKEVYEMAKEKARKTMRAAKQKITLKLDKPSHIPVRVVRKGEERFVSIMD